MFARRRALVLRVTRLFRLCKGRGPSSKVLRVLWKLLSATDVAETTVIAFPADWSGPWENQLSPYLDREGLRLLAYLCVEPGAELSPHTFQPSPVPQPTCFAWFSTVFWCSLLGVRIGEAKNPGPKGDNSDQLRKALLQVLQQFASPAQETETFNLSGSPPEKPLSQQGKGGKGKGKHAGKTVLDKEGAAFCQEAPPQDSYKGNKGGKEKGLGKGKGKEPGADGGKQRPTLAQSRLKVLATAEREQWSDQVLANTMLNALGHAPVVRFQSSHETESTWPDEIQELLNAFAPQGPFTVAAVTEKDTLSPAAAVWWSQGGKEQSRPQRVKLLVRQMGEEPGPDLKAPTTVRIKQDSRTQGHGPSNLQGLVSWKGCRGQS